MSKYTLLLFVLIICACEPKQMNSGDNKKKTELIVETTGSEREESYHFKDVRNWGFEDSGHSLFVVYNNGDKEYMRLRTDRTFRFIIR